LIVSGALGQARDGRRSADPCSEGLAAWEQVYSVLTHPRCINCHTATDYPQQGDDRQRHFANVVRGPVACAVDVSIENKRPKIHRATLAVDCGLAVNPLGVESMFQAGVTFGLSQLMAKGAITLHDGVVEQRNFDGYVPPYMPDAPVAVDVHTVPSTEAPTGCGEPPVPVISPAVVNALTRLTGKRYRNLPLIAV
jgi:CO/xanthine dehydrogenase Mo-binding subunit